MKFTQRPEAQESLSPNLIPMIDIMFLLLLFFMLGADMGQRELEDVVVPKAQSAVPVDGTKARDWTTINVFHRRDVSCREYKGASVCRDRAHWRWSVRGQEVEKPEALAALVIPAGRTSARPDPASRTILIRADAQAPYGLAQQAMNICAQSGLSRIEVSASPTVVRVE